MKFLHNDASCIVSAPYLPDMGVNLFNMGFETSLTELKQTTQNKVVMLGNIPPRDVMAKGNPEDVQKSVRYLLSSLHDKSNVVFSCGGGMPPGVNSTNIEMFLKTIKQNNGK